MRLLFPALGLVAAAGLYAGLSHRSLAVLAGTARRMELSQLVDAADLIVEGEVLSERSRVNASGLIETEYVLRVDRTFYGEPLDLRIVRMPGGVLPDGRGLMLAGMPELERGEDVLLFLSAAGSTGMRMPVGLAQGKLRVVAGEKGVRRLVRDQSGLELVDPATGRVRPAPSGVVLDYAATVARIQAGVAARKARELSPAVAPGAPGADDDAGKAGAGAR